MNASGAIQNLGRQLRAEFDENAALRRPFETRWIDDLRQYMGVYKPELLKRLEEQRRSTLYLRKTKAKVDSIVAHLMELLFPPKGERNWDIGPSTTPEVHPRILAAAEAKVEAQLGRRMEPQELRDLTLSLAVDAANAMGDEMEMQLAEGPGRKSYRTTCQSVLFQGCHYGTGCLKGPLVERRRRERFNFVDAETGWALGSDEGPLWPYREFVSIWDIYPDLTAVSPEHLRFVWQRHLKTRKALLELCDWPGFDRAAIRAYVSEKKDGDAELAWYETEVRQTSGDEGRQVPSALTGRYRLLERWGYLPGSSLADAGVGGVDAAEVYSANVWLLGDTVVKAVLAPIEGVDIPYHWFFYSNDETAFFPEGIASIIRQPEKAFNASMRMILDNAAICAGPQFGVNMSALHEGTDPDEQYPFKTWKFKGGDDLGSAFQVYNVDSHIQDLSAVAKLMADWSDEVTTPRFMSGDSPTRGAAETASGLSMLIGAANITLKNLINHFDDGITRPFITDLYFWNMMFNPRDEIKGDFVISATGTSSLAGRDVQAQNVMRAVQFSENPRFKYFVKDDDLAEAVLHLLDIGPSIIRSREEARQAREEDLRQQARLQAEENVRAVFDEATKRGLQLPQVAMNMLAAGAEQLGFKPAQGGPEDERIDQHGAPQAQEGGEAAGQPVRLGGGQAAQVPLGA
jgi:hypothetical protein